MVEIKISRERCKNPLECALCLRVCPTAVFYAYPQNMRMFEETPSEEHILTPRFKVLCTACYECVKVCPNNAIEVKP